MRVLDISTYDIRHVRRSKLFLVLVLAYAFVLGFVALTESDPTADLPKVLVVFTAASILVVPVLALATTVLAIAGERETGTIRFLLGFPNGRSHVLSGKLLSRSVVVGLAVTLGLAIPFPILVDSFGIGITVSYAKFWALTLLLATTYAAIGVGISAATATKGRAVGAGAAVYFCTVFLWSPLSFLSVPDLLRRFTTRSLGIAFPRELFIFLESLSPVSAYVRSIELVTTRGLLVRPAPDGVLLGQPSVVVVILCFWLCAAPLFSYRRFRRADIS